MPDSKTVNLFSVEDNQVISFRLRAFLKQIGDFNLLGEATSGYEAVEQILQLKPDVVLVDIGLPDLDGINVTRRIKIALPGTRVLMLTASEDAKDVFESLDAGADGYVLKGNYSISLEMAIRSVQIGSVWLDPAIAKMVVRRTRKTVEIAPVQADTFASEAIDRLDHVAASNCKDGVCLVEPEFMQKLRQLNRSPASAESTSDPSADEPCAIN
jgi:two-component system, NarL family, response regulator LiaR